HLLIYLAASEHLAAAEFVRVPFGHCPGWLVAVALHVVFLLAQIALIGIGAGWLFFELVDIRPIYAMMIGQRVTIVACLFALGLLIAVPALAALLAAHAVGRL